MPENIRRVNIDDNTKDVALFTANVGPVMVASLSPSPSPDRLVFINYHAERVSLSSAAAAAVAAAEERARTSAAGAQRAARFYIELTLFTQSVLEREVVKLLLYSDSVFETSFSTSDRCGRLRFVYFYGTTTVKMVEVKITDDIKIGGNNPCFIIAEVGQNHQGDIEIAKKLIKAAKDAGASCVKFQKTCLKEKFTKKYLERSYDNPNSWGKTYGDHKKHLEFSETQYRELFKYAQEIGILFTASGMDMVSFDFLVNLKVPFIKIGSGDSNNLLFLKYAASKKVPLIISTGMVDKRAVKTIYDIISAQHKQFCLLHCISAYPVPYEDCNLTVLQDYKNTFDIPVGYSGQELGTAVALAAVALGAKVLEKHITLDKSMKGTDHVCSLTPPEFQQLVKDVRVIEAALGSPIKKVVTSEIPCIDKLQKSLVMGSTKNKGEILYPGDVKIKVAEPKGLNALHFEEVIYKTLVYDKKEDEPLNKGDFC